MAKKYSRTTSQRSRFTRHPRWLIALIVVSLISGGVVWLLRRQPATISPSKAPEASTPAKTQSTNTSPSAAPREKSQSSPTPTTPNGNPPKAPFGTFVSAHHVNGGDTIGSTCTTTPGASCVISFTSNGVTKSLPAKTTDSDGNTYWTWTPQSIGLTTGNWQVAATATLNNQTASISDVTALEVKS